MKFYISRKLYIFLQFDFKPESGRGFICYFPTAAPRCCRLPHGWSVGSSEIITATSTRNTYSSWGWRFFFYIYIFYIYQHFVRQTRVRSDERNKMSTSSGGKRCRSSRIWTTEIRKPKLECSLTGAWTLLESGAGDPACTRCTDTCKSLLSYRKKERKSAKCPLPAQPALPAFPTLSSQSSRPSPHGGAPPLPSIFVVFLLFCFFASNPIVRCSNTTLLLLPPELIICHRWILPSLSSFHPVDRSRTSSATAETLDLWGRTYLS